MKRKILLINNLYRPYERGGAERVVDMEANSLTTRHEVIVLTTEPWQGIKSLWPRATEEQGIRVYRFYPLNLFSYWSINQRSLWLRLPWHFLNLFNLHAALTVRSIINKEKPDVVHAHNLMGLGFLTPLIIRLMKVRYVQTVHDVQLAVPSGLIIHGQEKKLVKPNMVIRWYRALIKHLFKSPVIVIAASDYLLNFYREFGYFPDSKYVLLRNPAPSTVTPNPRQETQEINFLYLGQLEEHKGVNFLLNNFKKWDEPHARLHLIGRGHLEQVVRQASNDDSRIIYHGYISPRDLPDIFTRMDALILPTLCYENSPTVIYEALAHGLPVITSDIGGAGELIEQGKNGWLFPPGDSNQLIKILSSLMRSDLAKAAFSARESITPFSLSKHRDRLESLYFRLDNP